jgi:hypothetical protein
VTSQIINSIGLIAAALDCVGAVWATSSVVTPAPACDRADIGLADIGPASLGAGRAGVVWLSINNEQQHNMRCGDDCYHRSCCAGDADAMSIIQMD